MPHPPRRSYAKISKPAGAAYELLLTHVSAEGASAESLEEALDERGRQEVKVFEAPARGFWEPPALADAKNWIKGQQFGRDLSAKAQVGYRLKATPGQWVRWASASAAATSSPKGGALAGVLLLPFLNG
ncbi:MAG: hypothetical protein M3N53_12895 [Actinomycetota bacterium]|nr:hypothetical protein [Actinomycetota bacterium]